MFRLLALDFDGVISNSAPEAFVVGLRCYASMRAETRLGPSARRIDGKTAPDSAVIGSHELYPWFLDLMPLGNRAEDYGVVFAAADAGREIADQEAYDAFRAEIDPQWLRAYHKRFYELRTGLAESDPEGWLRLMSPYAPFLEVLRRHAADVMLCIATAKDRGSVQKLLRAYGIDDLFSEDRVLDKETGVKKSAHLEHLHRQLGLDYAEMTFIDDKVNHLDDVCGLGVRCVLATWGFNGSREVLRARAAGHLACTLDDVEEELFA